MSLDSKKLLKKIIKRAHKYCEPCRSSVPGEDGVLDLDATKCHRCGESDDIFLDGSDELKNAIMEAKEKM